MFIASEPRRDNFSARLVALAGLISSLGEVTLRRVMIARLEITREGFVRFERALEAYRTSTGVGAWGKAVVS